jgi:hypothetical protein
MRQGYDSDLSDLAKVAVFRDGSISFQFLVSFLPFFMQ